MTHMKRLLLLLALGVLVLSASPGVAQADDEGDIPAGLDAWNTPAGGSTYLTLTSADWQALCGVSGASQQITLQGSDIQGYGDADTLVRRLDDAEFAGGDTATVDIVVEAISFVSESAQSTPCGTLSFSLALDGSVEQRTSQMTIERESSAGGTFHADILVDAVITATGGGGGSVGSLPYSGDLLDPQGGTPWAYAAPAGALNPNAPWHPGVTTSGQPVVTSRSYQDILAAHAYKPPKPKCKRVIIGPADNNSIGGSDDDDVFLPNPGDEDEPSPSPSPSPIPCEAVVFTDAGP